MPRIPVVVQQGAAGTSNPSTRTSPVAQTGAAPAMPREHFPDRQANQIQQNARSATRPSGASDDAAANVLRAATFVANQPQSLVHYLGTTWTSYRVENVRGAFARFYATPSAATDARTITITADANCTADVRVW